MTAAPTTTAPPTTTARRPRRPGADDHQAPTTTVAGRSRVPDAARRFARTDHRHLRRPVIRVTGWVPSLEKAAQLEALALANSTDPTATVESNWTHRSVRSAQHRHPRHRDELAPLPGRERRGHARTRRPARSCRRRDEPAAECDRHGRRPRRPARRRGGELRALRGPRRLGGAVPGESRRIDPSRLAARAVGEQDLLAEDESDASLALNRRTEFIFYGLLAD